MEPLVTFRKRLFARLLSYGDRASDRVYGALKRRLFADLSGHVLEIGPGSGVNFKYLPEAVETWTGIEPNPAFFPAIRSNALDAGIPIELINADAANIPMPEGHFDAVICTLVLCSVNDPQAVVSEIKRVLRPGGKFIFVEHVAADDSKALRWGQTLFDPVSRAIADGCRCTRPTGQIIADSGFKEAHIETFDPGPWFFFHRPHVAGWAVG